MTTKERLIRLETWVKGLALLIVGSGVTDFLW